MLSACVVQVWRTFIFPGDFEPNRQSVEHHEPLVNYQPVKRELCEGVRGVPNFQKAKSGDFLTVPGGILNGIVCGSLPEPPLTSGFKGPLHGKDYWIVEVTADEDGVIRRSRSLVQNNLGKQYEKIAERLRIQPAVMEGKRYKCDGALIFYRSEDYSKF